jgi:molybdopterin-guanine dinucleotide biosynthesis protein A
MTAEALSSLAANCADADAAVPEAGALPGAYARRALPVLEQRLEAGRLDLRDALGELDTRTIQIDPALLVNVNTERDLDRLRALAG